jgi:hypothetical protein
MLTISDSKISPFDAWNVYVACTLHFKKSSSYNAFKFNFKCPNLRASNFATHRHRFFFEKIARKYPTKSKAIGYYVSNILEGNLHCSQMQDEPELRWQARLQSIEYIFLNNMKDLQVKFKEFDAIFKPRETGSPPPLYEEYISGRIPIETLVILDQLIGYSLRINKNLSDPFGIVSDVTHYVISYKPFLHNIVDVEKTKQTVYKLFTTV